MFRLNTLHKIALIGAGGSSGLAALNSLKTLNHGFLKGFEQKPALGGSLWTTQPGSFAAYGLTTNVSKFSCAYASLPHLDSTSIFPTVEEMKGYLQRYAQRSELEQYIAYDTTVQQVDFKDDQWAITSSTAQGPCVTERFDVLVLATGMFSVPHMPEVPNSQAFEGAVLHSSRYKQKFDFHHQKVVIVGDGVSSAEIATDLAGTAASVTQLVRTAQPSFKVPKWLVNKEGHDIPWDLVFYKRTKGHVSLTRAEKNRQTNRFLTQLTGQNDIPALYIDPDSTDSHRVMIVPKNYSQLIRDQRITLRHGSVASFQAKTLTLADGHQLDADAVIFSTGYRPNLSFFSPTLMAKLQADKATEVQPFALYESFMHPRGNLFCIGLSSFLGPYPALAEVQAEAMVAILSGKTPYPYAGQLAAYFEQFTLDHAAGERRQFVNSDYPTLGDTYARLAGTLPPASALTQCVGLPFGTYQYRLNSADHSVALDTIKSLQAYMKRGSPGNHP